jgi:RNA polymerase sigma factor (sigma-70 family)
MADDFHHAQDEDWRAFKEGDRCAFASIYKKYIVDLLNYGQKVTRRRSVIEDGIQDLFIELWQSRHTIASPRSVKFYLIKALRYKIVRNIRENELSDSLEIVHFENELSIPCHESNLIGFEMQSLRLENLKSVLQQLPRRQQEAINLRFYHNFSNEEVANIMGLNYQSACNLIYAALAKLKIQLQVSIN